MINCPKCKSENIGKMNEEYQKKCKDCGYKDAEYRFDSERRFGPKINEFEGWSGFFPSKMRRFK